MAFAERKVMELAEAARACWVLCLAAGEIKEAARFMQVERQSLGDIGLERRAKELPSLTEYLKQRHYRKPNVIDAQTVPASAEEVAPPESLEPSPIEAPSPPRPEESAEAAS